MNQKTELKLNIVVVLLSQILMLVANFFTKQAILLNLNAEYMGLQTVCANLCDLLSMAFTASGMVMLYRLYRPLEEHNELKISSVFVYFRKIFRNMAVGSVFCGIILSVITVLCVNISVSSLRVLFYYWIYLAGVMSYNLFLYNYYFLMADQKRYISSGVCGAVDITALIFEILALKITRNYTLFLFLIITKNLIENGIISLYRKKHYKYVFGNDCSLVDVEEKRGIKKNIFDMIISKIGTLLLYNSDSVIISAIVSTTVSGYYSCYYFIVYGLQFTMTTVFDTLVPKIGQLSVREGKQSQYRSYMIVSLFNILCTAVCVSGFYLVCEDFILLWVGSAAILDSRLITIIAINLYISMTRYTSSTFRQAEGLFGKVSGLILFRGLFNIILSIIMGYKFGLLGIIAATSISDGLTVFWYEPYMIHKYYNKKLYFAVIYEILAIAAILLSIFSAEKATAFITEISWPYLMLKIVIVAAMSLACTAAIASIVYITYKTNRERIDRFIDGGETENSKDEETLPSKNDKHLKFSFILPVYNGSSYIKTAINSVLKEKDIDLELIVIDDGSTDNTYSIVNNIAESDQRLKLIHTENQGQGLARNTGINNASGDYIAFIDADDILMWDGMKQLIKHVNEIQWDVICGNYYKKKNNHKILGIRAVQSGIISHGNGDLYNKIKTESVFGYCWNKLFRAEFLKENKLQFDDIRKLYMEDTLFCLKVFTCEPKYFFCDVPVYLYTMDNKFSDSSDEADKAERYTGLISNFGNYIKTKDINYNDLLVSLSMRVFCWSQFRKTLVAVNKKIVGKENIQNFLTDKCFQSIVNNKNNIKELNSIPGFAERILLKTCFRLLNRQMTDAANMIFLLFNPLFNIYNDFLR